MHTYNSRYFMIKLATLSHLICKLTTIINVSLTCKILTLGTLHKQNGYSFRNMLGALTNLEMAN